MARINADGIKGMQPKISFWGNGGGEGVAARELAGVYRMLPPLMATVHEQTGMLPPAWMGTLADNQAATVDTATATAVDRNGEN
ncbi:hypothetical protein HPP92_022153 [Vanilla planifolia]|uniref:Flotillin-like n=1 Tax=Vanilla planifolia TaxID=51239 RepID=A0A835UFD6_VANPL|nr:hypothetical protein HPP92_022153 [Vanilla planifolia]